MLVETSSSFWSSCALGIVYPLFRVYLRFAQLYSLQHFYIQIKFETKLRYRKSTRIRRYALESILSLLRARSKWYAGALLTIFCREKKFSEKRHEATNDEKREREKKKEKQRRVGTPCCSRAIERKLNRLFSHANVDATGWFRLRYVRNESSLTGNRFLESGLIVLIRCFTISGQFPWSAALLLSLSLSVHTWTRSI